MPASTTVPIICTSQAVTSAWLGLTVGWSAAATRFSLLTEVACDEQALDLAGAFVDLRDAGVAVVALDGIVLEVAVAAVDLDRVRADLLGELGSEELGLGGLGQARQA